MKKLIVSAVIIFAAFLVSAQQDPKAKSILENVTKTTQSYTTIQATFDYIMENKEEGIHEENKGNILMKGAKYQLKLPLLGLEVYCDGKQVWTYMKDANEVTVAEIDEDSGELMNPSKLFTIYEHGFNYKFIEETTVEGTVVYVIDLLPQTKSMDYSRVRIYIDKQKMLIKKAEMIGQEGNNYIVKVNDLKTNVAADDYVFVFNAAKHPGVEVIDLR